MRLLHTADWHLGRLFHGRSLIEDQAYALDGFVRLVGESRPDVVLIAGDVYDRAVPPFEAVNLLDEVLSQIVLGHGVPVVLIAGNHDSPDRLGFGSRLLASRGLTLAGRLRPGCVDSITLEDRWGGVCIHALPYAEPALVRDWSGQEVGNHDAAMGVVLDAARAAQPGGMRSVIVAHAFVAGGGESDSERPLSVGGSGSVGTQRFDGFDYVALGHLHRPQNVGGENVRYAGSLLKYSLSEVDHDKSVSLVELGESGLISVQTVALPVLRDLRLIEGDLQNLIAAGRADPQNHDYVFARLADRGALLDPVARLREVYPNVLGCERVVLRAARSASDTPAARARLDTRALFADFVAEVSAAPLDEAETAVLAETLEGLESVRREGGQ